MTAAALVLEDKLAETAPKQPLALTIGAAAVTLIVVIGVLAGPSVVNCFNSADGMGVCLRGKMTDAGILPAPAAIAAPEVEAPPAEAVAVVDPGAEAVGEPALDVTPPAEAPDDLIAATFGLLRAEPDGSVVIAGSGRPGSEIEVYSGESLLGAATVEPSGDWVLVPDAPIPPGGTEITLAEAGKAGRAAQSFVVVINDDKTSEPLVVASTPGSISEVLQGLDRPASDTPTQLAAADPVAPPAAAVAPATPAPAAAPVEPAPAPVPVEPIASAAPPPAKPPVAPAAAAEPVPASPPAASTSPAADTAAAPAPAVQAAPAPAATPVAPAPAPPAATSGAPATPATTPAEAPAQPRVEAAPAAAAATPAAPAATAAAPSGAAAPTVAATSVPPTIDAIEIEGDRTFFAGAGPEGATMRLYVDDAFIADATVTDGRWLVEAGKVLTKPEQRVRVDMLEGGSADVAARAEVDFVVDLPAPETPTAVAAVEPPAAPPASDTAAAEPAQPGPAAPAAAATEPAPATAQAEAPAAPPPAADAPAPAAEPAVPTLVAVSVGGPDAERFASGKAIIRRGDNLWTIARRVYGEGIKYTTIYDANTGQIRDPDEIYPGQVFELPAN